MTLDPAGGQADRSDPEDAIGRSAEIELDEETQPLTDALIDALGGDRSLVDHPALSTFQERCNENDWWDGLLEFVLSEEGAIRAPWPDEVIGHAVDSFEGHHTHEEIISHIRTILAATLAGDDSYWDPDRNYFVAGPLRHSDGRARVLGFTFAMIGEPIECHGIFADRAAFETWIASQGRLATAKDLEATRRVELLRLWGEHY